MSTGTVLWVAPLLFSQAVLIWRYWLSLKREAVLKSASATLANQVATLQAHPDSWQSGYDAGRRMGSKDEMARSYQLDRIYKGAEQDKARLDSGMIIIAGRDEFGETTRTHARGLDLRRLIDEAIMEQRP